MRPKPYQMTRRLFVLAGMGTAISVASGCSTTTPPKPSAPIKGSAKPVPEPKDIPKFSTPLLVPPAMPKAGTVKTPSGAEADYYEIAMRQFEQQVLPDGYPKTAVWGYGANGKPETFNAPSLTIEATVDRPVRVKWINQLVDDKGDFLPHLLPVDQTIHWANPPGGDMGRDMKGTDPTAYKGPVPIITHVHGVHTKEESDGFPLAWFLPDAKNIPDGYAKVGSSYEKNRALAEASQGTSWEAGSATFEYPNDQRAATLWYHDHAMGMTRLNVYTGPAGFYLLRGGPSDEVKSSDGSAGVLPGSAGDPAPKDRAYEVPIAIQDRSFNPDGSLFYPGDRAYFEGVEKSQLKIPFVPERACDGPSDIAPIWNPEFFGSCLIANGRTWPYMEVEPRRYRLRFLNGCQARFLVLQFDDKRDIWQIGSEGGFLPKPVKLSKLLVAPAERADVIVDFAGLKPGTKVRLLNLGPDEPYNGEPWTPANPATTGQVMEFRVVAGAASDPTTPPDKLILPSLAKYGAAVATRRVSLNELESATVRVLQSDKGDITLDCKSKDAEHFGPLEALLGTVDKKGRGVPLHFQDAATERPKVGATEIWEIHNYTGDAHPIHVHQTMFEVLDRRKGSKVRKPEAWETGHKDTVIAYPEQVTRIKAYFDIPGTFVWHCHIIEHEDNEMMRPYIVEP
jgi:spore coat protein A, manganese oxidase